MELIPIIELEKYGWNDFWERYFAPFLEKGFSAGRVALEHRKKYQLYTSKGILWADIRGKFFHKAKGKEDLPVVGDWVVIRFMPGEEKAVIHELLPRKSKFSRKVKGQRLEQQIVAANVDTVFIITGLDDDFNLRRIERYLTLAHESGAEPVIILNKADLINNPEEKREEVARIAQGAPIVIMSALNQRDYSEIAPYIRKGETIALLGSSGVGKSTIINQLIGEKVQKVHDDVQVRPGQHVTTHRQLFLLPSGALIIDTPGMRELQLWVSEQGLEEAFGDILALAEKCYFSDCQHINEPHCAVREALENGTLSRDRYESYLKLKQEIDKIKWEQKVKKKPESKRAKMEQKERKYKKLR